MSAIKSVMHAQVACLTWWKDPFRGKTKRKQKKKEIEIKNI